MENTVCSFTVLNNPSRKYANTVNLVFFRAIPLSKTFETYVDGLKNWKKYVKLFPESQLQIFIDEYVSQQPEIMNIMHSLNARIYKFECPEYLRENMFHVGLFPTMVRFYPMFDINTKPMRIAHIQELEPAEDTLHKVKLMEKASRMTLPFKLSLIYSTSRIFEKLPAKLPTFENDIQYGWLLAGRLTVLEKIPFSLFTAYLDSIINGKKYFNPYVLKNNEVKEDPAREKYQFGVDEMFLNHVYLPWLIQNNKAIGIIVEYTPSLPVYFSRMRIRKDRRSIHFFKYILGKSQAVDASFREFDKLLYVTSKASLNVKQDLVRRFDEVVQKYPDWLGDGVSEFILKVFKGYVHRVCMLVVQSGKIVAVKDMD